MKVNKILGIAAVVLGAAFVVQVGIRYLQGPPAPVYMASWKHAPKSLEEATSLSKTVVEARVTRIRQATHLEVDAPGEPGGKDKIAQEVVTLEVVKTHKGTASKTVEVHRTGSSVPGQTRVAGRAAPTEGAPPEPAQKRKGAIPRPAQIPAAPATATTVLLEDAPAYRVGDRYLLFLDDGPSVNLEGATVKTQTVISPEGRYHIGANNKLEPISRRAFEDKDFAVGLRGKDLPALETVLKQKLQMRPGMAPERK